MQREVGKNSFRTTVDSATAAKLSKNLPYRGKVNGEWCFFGDDSFVSRPDGKYDIVAFRFEPPWPVEEE